MKKIVQPIHSLEKSLNSAKQKLLHRFGRPKTIKSYRGHGSDNRIILRGRVLANKDRFQADPPDNPWINFVNSSQNWCTCGVPNASLEARYRERSFQSDADDQGYFQFEIPNKESSKAKTTWQTIPLEISTPKGKLHSTATAQLPGSECGFGVISDIDDTVIHTGSTNLIQAAQITLFGNTNTNVVFKGIVELFDSLRKGLSGDDTNPFFYITRSPWNLYNHLNQICQTQSLPKGTIFMSDRRIRHQQAFLSKPKNHKLEAIQEVLGSHPGLPFILIGDSGQKDPEIYSQVVSQFPKQILAVYIRNGTNQHNQESIQGLGSQCRSNKVDLVLAKDSMRMAEHAEAKGWIQTRNLSVINDQVKLDRSEKESSLLSI